jgi:transcription elongation factor SPT6
MYAEEDLRAENESGQRERRVEDIYEPAEIEEKMFTKRDELIRERDVPERFQVFDIPSKEPDFDEIKREALWIARHLKQNRRSRDEVTENSSIVNAIKLIIQFIRVDLLEIPFIQRHREDYYISLMDARELWDIYDLNSQWIRVNQRKQQLQQWTAVAPELEQLLDKADSEEALTDLGDLLQIRYRKV